MNAWYSDDRFTVEPSVSNHFSWIRTRLAVERTFMAWMRTSVSLIGFGFTIVTFFQRLQDSDGPKAMRPEAPRDFGLALIAAGVLSLAIAVWQYRQTLHYLWREGFKPIAGIAEKPHWTPVFVGAITIMLIGMFAFGSVFIRF
jgi:putative membrane protein